MSTISLPTTSDTSVNPWTYAHDVLRSELYPNPTRGFKGRVVAVVCIIVYSFVVAGLLLFLHDRHTRRTKKGVGMWVYRIVRTDTGRLIVGNSQVITDISTLIYAPFLIGYAIAPYHMFAHQTSQANLMALIAGFLPFGYFFGYLISAASVQAWFLVAGSAQFPFITAKAVNIGFFAVGGVIVSALVILAGLTDLHWRRTWNSFVALEEFLLSQAPSWNGTSVDSLAWALATEMLQVRYDHMLVFRKFTRALFIVFAPAPLILAITCLAPIVILVLLRRQIRYNKDARLFSGTVVTLPVGIVSASGYTSPQLQRIQELERAEQEYFAFTVSNIFIDICLFIFMMWWLVMFKRFRSLDWPSQEALIYIQCWWWGLLFSVMSTIRLVFLVRNLLSPVGASLASDPPPSPPPVTAHVSLGAGELGTGSDLELGEEIQKEGTATTRGEESWRDD